VVNNKLQLKVSGCSTRLNFFFLVTNPSCHIHWYFTWLDAQFNVRQSFINGLAIYATVIWYEIQHVTFQDCHQYLTDNLNIYRKRDTSKYNSSYQNNYGFINADFVPSLKLCIFNYQNINVSILINNYECNCHKVLIIKVSEEWYFETNIK